MARTKRIYVLIIKVNKLFSFFPSRCLIKEIEHTRESLGELEKAVQTLALDSCSPTLFLLLPNFHTEHVSYFLSKELYWFLLRLLYESWLGHHSHYAGEVWKRNHHQQFWFCVWEKLGQWDHMIIMASFFSEGQHFQITLIWKAFSRWIRVESRPNLVVSVGPKTWSIDSSRLRLT